MAKVKVYELAKELDKQSKDILTFLADKGVEVKSHMSVLEEDVAEMVKSAFSGTQTAKPEKKEEAREAAVKGTEKKEESQTEQAKAGEAKNEGNRGEAPKKKKKHNFCQQSA